ncbi:MAG: carboxypeptidase-like regulatory domain-containing protein, partial [Tenuifilaceae bacterium]|nr:carboxypeptidase-like regulatory domain-containing protein [Tenuifilaceae bacterium]
MKRGVKYIILFFALIFKTSGVFSQFFLYNETPTNIEISFARTSIEAAAHQSFFNVLIIKNNANHSESVSLNITVPEGWTIIGEEKRELTLSPQDSLIIPIRVAVGGDVRGDIGYSIIASISDARGNTIKNEYSYVKIPRITKLSLKYTSRFFFFDPTAKSAEFGIEVQNRGNREEPVSLIFDGNRIITLGLQRETLLSEDITVPPYTDTLLVYRVFLEDYKDLGRNLFPLQAFVSTIDSVYQNTLWFRQVESTHKNIVPSYDKPLAIEAYAQGLLDANVKPNYTTTVQGKLLFKGDKDVYYYYRNFSSRIPEDFYKTNRMYIGGSLGSWTLELGDSYKSIESSMTGRGAYLSYDNKSFSVDVIGNQNQRTSVNNYGSTMRYRFSPLLYINTGLAYNENKLSDFNSMLGYIGTGININNKHRFYMQGSFNKLQRPLNNKTEHNEFGWDLNYNSNVGSFTSYIKAKYASDLYYSPFAGKFELFSNFSWTKDEFNKLEFYYNETATSSSRIHETTYIKQGKFISREASSRYRHFFNDNVEVYGGPIVNNMVVEDLNTFIEGERFSSLNLKASAGARIKDATGTTIITPRFEFGMANIIDNPFLPSDSIDSFRKNFNFYHLSFTLRSRSLMMLAFFTSGPRSSFDQMNYLRTGKQSRKLQFMPTYEDFIYKNIIKTRLSLNFSNDMITKSMYTNLIGQVNWFLPKDWELQIIGVYSLQNRINFQDLLETYQNIYLEIGVKKEFNLQQPRVKYHDIEFVFFRDYNGNFTKEDNEPGIKNILVNIEKVKSEVLGDIPGDFFGTELISDNLGRVMLEKIPEGIYKITYNPIGKETGTYSKAIEDMEIKIDRTGKYFFPFVERNKVFGKIILNRSRLSGLGRIDVSNVRITVTDSHGRSYSTLTDKNGEFTLFAPVTDEYIVNINNIFYENFDLRQNNFLVQFNGYKQFEVNFVLDEKVRRINFASTDTETQAGVQQVRRTTISGTIKDINTQQPVRAKVNLINTRTNSVMTSISSSATNGGYTLQFMANDDYLLEILADDYWYFSENIVLQQVTTFMNVDRDILLKPISVGSKVELNIRFEANSAHLAPESVAEINRLLRQVKNNP